MSRSARQDRERDFKVFVESRSARLRLIARTICGDATLADDLVQEALERTWVSWSKLDDHDPFAWTRRVLVNLNIDRHRRRRWRENQLDDAEGSAQYAVPGDATTRVLDQQWIARLLDGLTDRERATVVLRYLEDMSEAQTALELDMAVGTVKSTCARALAKLRHAADESAPGAVTPAQIGGVR